MLSTYEAPGRRVQSVQWQGVEATEDVGKFMADVSLDLGVDVQTSGWWGSEGHPHAEDLKVTIDGRLEDVRPGWWIIRTEDGKVGVMSDAFFRGEGFEQVDDAVPEVDAPAEAEDLVQRLNEATADAEEAPGGSAVEDDYGDYEGPLDPQELSGDDG